MSESSASSRVTIEALWVSPGHDFKGRHGQERLEHGMIAMQAVECHAGRGLVGDRYYDFKPDFKGQLTLFAMEHWEALVKEMEISDPDPSACRRNILIRGLDLNALIGKVFHLGEVKLEGVEEAKPCYWMNGALGQGALEKLEGRGGLRCRILGDGWLRLGSTRFCCP